MAGPIGRFNGNAWQHIGEHGLGSGGVAIEVIDHHLHGHVGFVDFPTIIISDHRHGGVGDLRFACALGFAEIGHADHIVLEPVIGERFGARAKGGAFHVHVGAAVVYAGLFASGTLE